MPELFQNLRTREEHPVYNTQYGPVSGIIEGEVAIIRGIPFAKPPVKQLRFLPPEPPEPWTEVLDCHNFRDSAMQASEISPTITHSEDCLHLNIWAPASAKEGDNLPVLVYIHGGGFSDGSPAKFIFDGSHFANDGIIQINISYRLGALGFMAFEKIEKEHGFLGNCGLLDQLAALRWVQDNIHFFGGDTNCITVSGESAGSFSVSSLLLSPLAKGLFQRAILESGNILGQPIVAPGARGARKQAIVTSQAYTAAMQRKSLPGLQLLDARQLVRGCAFSANMIEPPRYNFWPVFDGKLLPENPYKALLSAPINEVDLLCGYNAEEGSFFISRNATEEDYIRLCQHIFGDNSYEVLRRFPSNKKYTAAQRGRDLIEMGLRFGSDVFADELSRRGKKVWHYHFNHAPRVLDLVGMGPTHAIELMFVFKTIPKVLLRNPSNALVADDVHARWANFIKTGNPNEGMPVHGTWPAYHADNKQSMVLQEESFASPTEQTDEVDFYLKLLWGEK